MSFLAIPFLYPSEINSSRMRNLGNSIAMITNWVFVYVVVLMTPSGEFSDDQSKRKSLEKFRLTFCAAIANIAWKFYIIFAVLNFAWAPIVWIFYVETKGLSLEEVDLMFKVKYNGGAGVSYKQAAQEAKERINAIRLREQEQEQEEKDGVFVERKENVVDGS